MRRKKKLKELTFKDNFMFGAVMADEENCREFLELTLGFPIDRVKVCREKSFIYHPEYKGIRLDIYAKDRNNTHYDVEMQVVKKDALGKRTRYYHSEIDMELLLSGMNYSDLPEVYIIFICDFDPFGKGKYCYTFENCCVEDSMLKLKDGCRSIFLNTHGKNDDEMSEAMIRFLHFVKADLKESTKDFQDDFVRKLQNDIHNIKVSREMEGRFMLFEELLNNEYLDGRLEGRHEGRLEGRHEGRLEAKIESIIELLEDINEIPESIRKTILSETDPDVLSSWHKLAARVDSMEQFIKQM